ncbi:MAG: protein kinase, partial [Thermoanaerobaculia bacterium]
MTITPGTRFGPYEVVAPLGAGGMGEVYRATDTRLARDVALKIISPEWARNDQVRLRFGREARAISALSHPHICTLHDVGEQGDLDYLVMEFLEGETLAQRLGRDPLSIHEAVRYGTEIADALDAAHSRGITHRDIKPSNIMITRRGSVKILDFGLAKLDEGTARDSDATALRTQPGTTLGTIRYMSPEQASADEATAASDIFSFGIVMYEAFTGRHPFEAQNRAGMLHALVSLDPVRPSGLRPDVPAAIDALLLQMLSKQREARPAAADVRSALQSISEDPAAEESPLRVAIHLVGRKRERAQIEERLDRHRGSVISVTGEPGLGKTTLVEKILAEASPRMVVAVGRCSERLAGTEAYLPIMEALSDLMKRNAVLGQSLKLLAPAWYRQIGPEPVSSPDGAAAAVPAAGQERLKRELAAFFEQVTKSRPVLLFLDDVHWADVSTIDLLAYLSSRLESMRLFVITTARPSELLLQKHPFLNLTRELKTRGRLHEIALNFLTWDDVGEYLQMEFAGNAFPAAFHRLVFEKTEGSPLFMVDLLRYLRDENVLSAESGQWTLSRDVPEIEREIPESVRSMIDKKIDQLSDEERKILVAASVQGAEFDSVIVAAAAGVTPGEAEDLLARLERVHQFVSAIGEREFPDGTPTLRYRFVHVLYQNTLYASLGPSRRAVLSGKIATALLDVSCEKAAPIASQVALLLESAREFSRAADFFLIAAQHARRLYANQ